MPPTAFDQWFKTALAGESIRAKSLLVTILGDSVAPHGGGIWLGALIALLEPFNVTERLVRTSVFRLANEGWIEATRLGRRSLYTLSAAGRRRIEHADRRIYTQPDDRWDGLWTLVLPDASPWRPAERADLRRDLLWEGYAPLAGGLYGHPSGALEPLGQILEGLGLAERVAVFQARMVPARTTPDTRAPTDRDLVQSSWPLAVLAQRYQAFCERFAPFVDDGTDELDPARCFQLCTLLVHAYRRVVLQDPQLPVSLLPANWPGHRAFADCGAIYHQAAQRAEQHFRAAVATAAQDHESGSDSSPAQSTGYLMRRFGAALAVPARTGAS